MASVSTNNNNPYGAAVIKYAERWANMMEAEMRRGKTLQECAEQMAYASNHEDISGFMHSCAVDLLCKVWAHGDALRCWNNDRLTGRPTT